MIEKVLRGETQAYAELVREYQPRLVAFLWNLLGSGGDARDVCQDAFTQAYLRLSACDPARGFKSWLFGIAYHRGIDFLRRRRSFWEYLQREGAAGCGAAERQRAWHRLEESPLLFPLLKRISPRERAILALVFNENHTAAEVADVLGLSESTVRVHLLNARRKLKRELVKRNALPAAGPAEEETT